MIDIIKYKINNIIYLFYIIKRFEINNKNSLFYLFIKYLY